MSNVIPDMVDPQEFPYCIWYYDVAEEHTYRTLFHRHHQMRYHVGRACAVAGYTKLYGELGLLPDLSIAEEARDNKQNRNSKQILDDIMSQPLRWAVMKDCARSVNVVDPCPAEHGLNADTAVVSTLGRVQGFEYPDPSSRYYGRYQPMHPESHPSYFNITEDWSIGEPDTEDPSRWQRYSSSNGHELTSLLWNPLPFHLPEGNKDLLILMAAYYGDIDRYERLRRPISLKAEPNCIVRGIYHNTMFAKWWSLQPDANRFGRAINARFIMNNDLSRINDQTLATELPYMIWYPTWANKAT